MAVVAPFTGAWIETATLPPSERQARRSHPSRVRGLKHEINKLVISGNRVAPFTGAWIETFCTDVVGEIWGSRTLHGCVD